MASRASARRYSRALFDVVVRSGDPMASLQELQQQVRVLGSYPELKQALLAVGVPLAAKMNVMRELIALQSLSPVVSRLLLLIVESDDVDEIAEVAADFERRVMDFHHVVRVELTTAVPLNADREQALRRALSQATGRDVRLDTRIDPRIVGGVIAKVGSRVFDGSVTRHLQRVRERLVRGPSL
jgi:F-type H+-transporting ATPase subunit delta